jgi:hypothetical protein
MERALSHFVNVSYVLATYCRILTARRKLASLSLLLFVVFGFSLATTPQTPQQTVRDSRYPAHWWTPVSSEGAPRWEVLPQAAGSGEVILSKRNELGLLSNFAATPFTFEGKRYASLEGFWQMMKYPEGPTDPRAKVPGLEWKYTREQVGQMTSFDAKNAGTLAEENMKKMGISWVTFGGKQIEYRSQTPGEFYRLIVAATRAKVMQNPEVMKVLLATGDLILKPDHHQGDNPPPAWRYYDILTQIRIELQKDLRPAADLPLLTFADLEKGDLSGEPFRIVGVVIDVHKCPPCSRGMMCKPCIGDHITVTDDTVEKDPTRIKRLRIFTDKPEQFELKKKYGFTVKLRGKSGKGQPITEVELVSFKSS